MVTEAVVGCLSPLCAQSAPVDCWSVVRDASTEIVCTSPVDATVKERRVIEILNEKGRDQARFVCYCDRFSSLKKFAGEVRDAGGNVIRKLKKSDLQATEYSEHLASDDYVYLLDYMPPRYPVTISYEWELKWSDGIVSFPTFHPYNAFNQSVTRATYSLTTPADYPCRYRLRGIPSDALTQTTTADGSRQTKVDIRSLPPVQWEPYSAPSTELLPCIYFTPQHFVFEGTQGEMTDWHTLGNWQYGLLQGRDQLPPTLKEELLKRAAHCATPREKVAVVYRLLETTTRYVSIQLGIGGLQPIPADEVCRTGFGDCKGLSNYARAMLAELGIPSVYTIIHTDRKRMLPDFASLGQANHVILQVPLPGDTLWLECTNPRLPMGYVHHSIAGNDAVLITPEGGQLCRLPTYADSLNTQVNRATVTLQPDGTAQIDVQQSSRLFQYEDKLHLLYLTPDKQRDNLRETINLTQARVKDVSLDEQKSSTPQMNIRYTVDSGQYGSRTGKRLFVPLNIFHKGFYTPTQGERTHDIRTTYGYLDVDSITFRLPEGYRIEALPDPTELSTPFGTFHASVEQEGDDVLHLVHRLLYRQDTYPKEQYTAFQEFRKNVDRQYTGRIVLRREE
jgi:transglutaminase-like putative cysteine protease